MKKVAKSRIFILTRNRKEQDERSNKMDIHFWFKFIEL